MLPSRSLSRFFVGVFATWIVLAAVWLGLFRAQLGKPTSMGAPLHEIIRFKQDAVRADSGPRVLLAGGSNVTYSFSATELSRIVQEQAYNFGSHAGLTLGYLLDLVAAEVRAGDVVILVLEYQLYGDDGRPTATQVDYVCGYDPSYLGRLSILEQAQFVFSMKFFGFTEPSLSLLQRSLHVSRPTRPMRLGRSFSGSGDAHTTTIRDRTDAQFRTVLASRPADLDLDGSEASWAMLAAFVTAMKDRDVEVYATWPATRDFEYYRGTEASLAFRRIEDFFAGRDVPVLGKPSDFFFPAEDFFDTPYHLILEKQPVPTQRLGQLFVEARRGEL